MERVEADFFIITFIKKKDDTMENVTFTTRIEAENKFKEFIKEDYHFVALYDFAGLLKVHDSNVKRRIETIIEKLDDI